MDYVYDIILNFQDEYYDFYEWQVSDKIINIKKAPIYKITSKDYLNIKYHNVIFDKKSIPMENKIFLLTNGLEVMGISINNSGKVIKKSSLIFEESDDILSDHEKIKFINLKYTISSKHKQKLTSRINQEKSKYVMSYLKTRYNKKDHYYLRYLYYEIYNIDETDIDKLYQELLSLAKKDIHMLYENIKKVNLELNKP